MGTNNIGTQQSNVGMASAPPSLYATYQTRSLTSAGTMGTGDTKMSALEKSIRKCFVEDDHVTTYARQASMRGSVGNFSSAGLARQAPKLGMGSYRGDSAHSSRGEPSHQVTRIQRKAISRLTSCASSAGAPSQPSTPGAPHRLSTAGSQRRREVDSPFEEATQDMVATFCNQPVTEWEQGGHRKNFLTSVRSARVFDLPRGNTWCAHSFHEKEPRVIENHLRHVNAVEEARVNGLLEERHNRTVKDRIRTARQRELFNQQRSMRDDVYRNIGIQPGSKWRPCSAATDAPAPRPMRIAERIAADTIQRLDQAAERTQSARQPRSLRGGDEAREVRELDRWDQKLQFVLKKDAAQEKQVVA